MQRIYIDSPRATFRGSLRPIIFFCFIVAVVMMVSFVLVSAHNRAREDLIETLKLERELMETHNKLKLDLAGITQTRLLELKARERLGLTKPKEEEVVVLK
ncbi:MAG TPA: cell division protein FtsL [Syntrophorhabdaceae bacterium]|nr:cell division protein FtsL [Syntrophorhabdaceae bacterium]